VSDDDRAAEATLDAPLLSADSGAIRGPVLHASVVGQRFADRYDLESELGRGGMGVVYRARDTMLGGEPVALKVLFADASGAAAIERFRREVRLARRITSPHVARTHDLGEHGGVFYLTMELVEGESLAQRLHRLTGHGGRGLSPAEAIRIVRAVAAGLVAAHAADVVHRDLKPDNVLLEGEPGKGRVVVTDFGIARAFRGPEAIRATQGIAGTPAYMAPEQLEGKSTDARTDLYALGILLFECLTGDLPFGGTTPIAVALARLQESPRRLDPGLGIPPALEALVTRLLSRQPELRPENAAAVIAALDEVALPNVGTPSAGPSLRGLTPEASVAASSAVASVFTPRGTRSSVQRDVGIVVLPFEHRGDPTDAGVTSGVRDELIDVLSRTQSVRVLGRGVGNPGLAQPSLSASGDLRSLEARFGARFAVEAAVRVAAGGSRLRASVRLLEVESGVQAWSEALDLELADPFVASERMAYKIAEALRLALEVSASEGRVSREVLDAYRQARTVVRGAAFHDPAAVFAQLDRIILEAPGFAPAYALHAVACARFSFTPRLAAPDREIEVHRSIARALDHAGHLAETRFAAATVAWHEVRLRDAVTEARAALAIAPAYPDALAFLGQLELEVSRPEQGLERLRWARDLEPALRITLFEPCRWHGLYGDLAEYERLLAVIRREQREQAIVGQFLVRVGAWRGLDAMIREGLETLARQDHPLVAPLSGYGRAMLGESVPLRVPPEFLSAASPRLRTISFQMQAEVFAKLGDSETALEMIRQAADAALTDLEWVDKCPFFGALRADPRFVEARRRVYARCDEVWSSA
jgi:serine/threonine protein kinase/tetratricopeptide (TPR) repeat protein